MVKFKIGGPSDSARQNVDIKHSANADTDFQIDGARGCASQELRISEVNSELLHESLQQLKIELHKFSSSENSVGATGVVTESKHLLTTAEKSIRERKWYSISAEGLIEAAKAVGEAASPLVGAALKVVDLLAKAK
jgi:hypothetical protein